MTQCCKWIAPTKLSFNVIIINSNDLQIHLDEPTPSTSKSEILNPKEIALYLIFERQIPKIRS
jgi:hypothetical protein